MRTKDSIIEEIIQFFKDNKSVFTTAIEETQTPGVWTAVETRNMEPSIHIATISISTAAMAAW